MAPLYSASELIHSHCTLKLKLVFLKKKTRKSLVFFFIIISKNQEKFSFFLIIIWTNQEKFSFFFNY